MHKYIEIRVKETLTGRTTELNAAQYLLIKPFKMFIKNRKAERKLNITYLKKLLKISSKPELPLVDTHPV